MTITDRLVALVAKGASTPLGKALEHAVVAGVSVGVSLLIKDAATGSLSLNDLQAAGIVATSSILAGFRAALKGFARAKES